MQITPGPYCATAKKTCVGHCPGYGTQNSCPPLIVIAVAAAQQISALRAVAR
ncbi:MAG TPA: hypothetical protein VGN16_08975 [Acidobacteriaceae bacterium]|jgi:predicted metal-binding protein